MAVKFPREAFAAILNGNKVALDWLASLDGASTTTVAATDLTAIEAEIAELAAQAIVDRAAIVRAQETAEDAPLLVPTYNLNPAEVLAITDDALKVPGGDWFTTASGGRLLMP